MTWNCFRIMNGLSVLSGVNGISSHGSLEYWPEFLKKEATNKSDFIIAVVR